MVEGVPVRAPRPDMDPQQYAGKVQAFKNQIVKQFGLKADNVRLNVLPFNQGFFFTDADGIPLELEFSGGKAKAIYGHQDIISWSQREGNAAIDAKATRAGGLAIIKGTQAESLKKIEESRKVIKDTTSWWSQLWGKK